MYDALREADTERVFAKLRKVLRSVVIEREIDTFENDMAALD